MNIDKYTKRHKSNQEIIEKLSILIEKFPDMRFHQLLYACGVEMDNEDLFYEESVDTLERMEKTLKKQYIEA